MKAQNYLFISCDGTKEIVPVLNLLHSVAGEGKMETISSFEAPKDIVIYVDDSNTNTFGCFRLDGPTKQIATEYNITGEFKSCQECNLDKFKTNQNVLNRFESARTEISNILESKLGKIK